MRFLLWRVRFRSANLASLYGPHLLRGEGGERGGPFASAADTNAATVKDQLVVAPNLIDITEWACRACARDNV